MNFEMEFCNSCQEFPMCMNGNSHELEIDFGKIITLSGLPKGGSAGDIIIKKSEKDYDAEWVPPADTLESGNKLPVTASAVYEEISKIDLSLATIAQINRLF